MQTDKKKSMITKTLPLTDIHRHLDGNIRIQTILELGQQYHLDLPAYDIESLRPHVQVIDNQPDLLSFYLSSIGSKSISKPRCLQTYCF